MWQSKLNIIPLRITLAFLRSKHSSVEGWGSYTLGKLMNTYHVYIVHMNPALSGSSALEHFERSNVIEICNRIMFDFYVGLPHMLVFISFTTSEQSLDVISNQILGHKE